MSAVTTGQKVRCWFDADKGPCPLTLEERQWMTSPKNPNCALSKYIGNAHAVSKVSRVGTLGLSREDHCISEQCLAWFAPSGTGKTDLARKLGMLLSIPFIEISPTAIKSMGDLHKEIVKGLVEFGYNIVEDKRRGHFYYPPCIVFLDECHRLPKSLVEGGMLKAIENKDRTLVTEKGITVNCFGVCWMVATTDRGKLFDAFDGRFDGMKLNCYTQKEIAQIVQINFPSWPVEACQLAARYTGKIPREALKFATNLAGVRQTSRQTWDGAAKQVAWEKQIEPLPENDDGTFRPMTLERLAILKALGNYGPISIERLQPYANVKIEELRKYTMPYLTEGTDDQPPYCAVAPGRGFMITQAGVKALEQRKLPYDSNRVVA